MSLKDYDTAEWCCVRCGGESLRREGPKRYICPECDMTIHSAVGEIGDDLQDLSQGDDGVAKLAARLLETGGYHDENEPEVDVPDEMLYLIEDGESRVKIGLSVDPTRRLSELQTSNPSQLKLLATSRVSDPYTAEARLHEEYREHQISGEWFGLSEEERSELVKRLNEIDGLI